MNPSAPLPPPSECPECQRIQRQLRTTCSGDLRAILQAEHREHLKKHGAFWLSFPWVDDVPILLMSERN